MEVVPVCSAEVAACRKVTRVENLSSKARIFYWHHCCQFCRCQLAKTSDEKYFPKKENSGTIQGRVKTTSCGLWENAGADKHLWTFHLRWKGLRKTQSSIGKMHFPMQVSWLPVKELKQHLMGRKHWSVQSYFGDNLASILLEKEGNASSAL